MGKPISNPAHSEEEEMVPKKILEKKEYQIDILKRAFNEYEETTVGFFFNLDKSIGEIKYRKYQT